MATGYSSILPQPSHGERDGDAGCSTHSPSGPRTLRRWVESRVSPQHADHDTEGGGHSRSPSSVHQNGVDQGGEEADVDSERGQAAVPWRADVTIGAQRGADDCARGHSTAESENSGVITFRYGENKNSENLQAAQPNSYDFSFSGVRAGEFNTSVASYVQSREWPGV